MASVQLGRLLDSVVLGLFVMVLSAASLGMFGHLYVLSQTKAAEWKIAQLIKMLFPFTKRFEYNLTHVLLFSIIICLLSIRSDSSTHEATIVRPQQKTNNNTTTQNCTSSSSRISNRG